MHACTVKKRWLLIVLTLLLGLPSTFGYGIPTAYAATPSNENFDGYGEGIGGNPRSIGNWHFAMLKEDGSSGTPASITINSGALDMIGVVDVDTTARIRPRAGFGAFKLLSFKISNFGGAGNPSGAGLYKVVGYRSGSMVNGASLDFSAPFSTYTTLTFTGDQWSHLDELRIVTQSGIADIKISIDDITVDDPVPDTTKPVITRSGDATLRIIAGSAYTDAGATATDNVDGNLTGSIVVTGTVNTSVPGVYTLRYNVSDASGNAADEVTRDVAVAPLAVTAQGSIGVAGTVTVSGATAGATLKLYDSEDAEAGIATADSSGAHAFTNVAYGNGYYVTQTVNAVESDASGSVNVEQDTTKPVITRSGDATIRIIAGGAYTDAGATATDDVEGDITGSIVVTGAVNTSVLGVYTLRYNVSDASGNAADEVTRDVTVAPAAVTAIGGTLTISISDGIVGALLRLFDSSDVQVGGDAFVDVSGKYSFSHISAGSGYYIIQTVDGIDSEPSSLITVHSPAPFFNVKEGAAVIVNGVVQESAATAKEEMRDHLSVTTITVDEDKLNAILAKVDAGYIVTIPFQTGSDVAVGVVTGRMISHMETDQATIEIETERAVYTIPAEQLNIDDLSGQFGENIDLRDVSIYIEIAEPAEDIAQVVRDSATRGGFEIVVPPLRFTVKAVYRDKTIEVFRFDSYAERIIAIPDSIDPKRITTGVVIDPDGAVHHAPTKVVFREGKYYASVNSFANGTYSIVWNPITFVDVENHWAKEAVNDMGSRMVITGTGGELFSPNRDITRAEFAAIIVRGLGLKLNAGGSPFTDVEASKWYNSAINTAYQYGLVNGFEDGTFRPNDRVTREQAMVIVAKAMMISKWNVKFDSESEAVDLHVYSDAASVSKWARSGVASCVEAGIVSGRSDERIAPKDNITRAEVAVIISRLLHKSGLI